MGQIRFFVLVCFLLIIAGYAIGGLLGSDISSFDKADKALSSLASIATICGIFYAYQNLDIWRKQFKHQKVDSILTDLEESVDSLTTAYSKNWESTLDLNVQEFTMDLKDPKAQQTISKFFKSMNVLLNAKKVHNKLLKDLSHYIELDSNDTLHGQKFREIDGSILERIEEIKKSHGTVDQKAFDFSVFSLRTSFISEATTIGDDLQDRLFSLWRQVIVGKH